MCMYVRADGGYYWMSAVHAIEISEGEEMPDYKYVIIGGGMAAHAAVKGIRSEDPDGTIAMIASESDEPYDRPPLSKGLWKGDTSVDEIMRDLPGRVDFYADRRAESFSIPRKEVIDDQDQAYTYERLLLATGGTPKRLPFDDEDQILYYRTLHDYRRLRELAQSYQKFVVIGGGFIGSELTAALQINGKDVTIVFPEEGICARLFPAELAQHLNEYYTSKGVNVQASANVVGLSGEQGDYRVELEDGRLLEAEAVVAGIGITPNTKLAEMENLQVDDGIVVNRQLQTSAPNIFAAGDVANFRDAVVGKRRRVEHEDNANTMGEAAGRSMTGADVSYDYSPMFYSDLFDLGYEAVGRLDSRLHTYADWQEEFEKGVIYYLDEGRLQGVLLWNVWDKVEEARDLIASDKQWQPEELKGRIS